MNEWVDVKDMLPQDEQKIVVVIKSFKKEKEYYVCLFQKKWSNRRNIFSIITPDGLPLRTVEEYIRRCVLPKRKITYWMALSEPPPLYSLTTTASIPPSILQYMPRGAFL